MILVPTLFTVKTALMIAFILNFEAMSCKAPADIQVVYFIISGVSERSIVATTIGSSVLFTAINLSAEFSYKLVNNQYQVAFVKGFDPCHTFVPSWPYQVSTSGSEQNLNTLVQPSTSFPLVFDKNNRMLVILLPNRSHIIISNWSLDSKYG